MRAAGQIISSCGTLDTACQQRYIKVWLELSARSIPPKIRESENRVDLQSGRRGRGGIQPKQRKDNAPKAGAIGLHLHSTHHVCACKIHDKERWKSLSLA